MDYLPIFLRLTEANSIVIGGGAVAARKIESLIAANARITVISPTICEDIERFVAAGDVNHLPEHYDEQQLVDADLVIAATNQQAINASVSQDAKRRHVPVNVVDAPELCSFIMPSIVDRNPVIIAVSSGGAAPYSQDCYARVSKR